MYFSVSKWRPLPGKAQEFEATGKKMRDAMRAIPGIVMTHGFINDEGNAVSVIGYESKEAWDKIVNDPNGPFMAAVSQNKLEEVAEWIGADRGDSLDD